MNQSACYNRQCRFWSSESDLWSIGDVFSHPPDRIESPGPLEVELRSRGYHDDMRTVDGRDMRHFIEEKAIHPRHIRMIDEFGENARLADDELLAIACYTGVGAYSDLRRSAAARQWERWPSFVENLIRGIEKLQAFDMGGGEPTKSLFHGIANATSEGTHGGGKGDFWIKFMMPISTTPERAVAQSFLNPTVSASSLILKFDPPFRDDVLGPSATYVADISWISQFPDEKEVLVFPVGDCMGGQLTRSFLEAGCNVREFSVGFSGDW